MDFTNGSMAINTETEIVTRRFQDESPETMQKLCLSIKFPHQEIRSNYGILRRASFISPAHEFCL